VGEGPGMAIAHDRLAHMLRAVGRPADAVAVLNDAARNGRADRQALRSLGAMLRDTGDLKRSASVLEPLVKGDASDVQSADALGQTYARMGRTSEAVALFTG